jgi:alginate O-acetyltransferase complex protein AlgI
MLPLPLGISFFTFKGISLVIDAYRSMDQATDNQSIVNRGQKINILSSILHILFFPQLLAGPITRFSHFQSQFRIKHFKDVPWQRAIKSIIVGYFLKMVVADNLKDLTFWIQYPQFMDKSSLDLLAFSYGYSIQIFADFAGYSLIAIGLSALFGYQVPANFNFPYIAQSFSEFWRRWHISLSTWLKDYLYIPLGGNRKGCSRTYLNLLITMFLGGLWHGAAWSFAIWGVVHGLALSIERPFLKTRFYLSRHVLAVSCRTLLVFSFVMFSWTFFILTDCRHVIEYFSAIINNVHYRPARSDIFLIGLYTLPVIIFHGLYLSRNSARRLIPDSFNAFAYATMLAAIVLNSGSPDIFIYFQF